MLNETENYNWRLDFVLVFKKKDKIYVQVHVNRTQSVNKNICRKKSPGIDRKPVSFLSKLISLIEETELDKNSFSVPSLDWGSRLLMTTHWTVDSSLPPTPPDTPDDGINHFNSRKWKTWREHQWWGAVTSWSLSELDSVSLPPAAAPQSAVACGESECGTATMVPSSLTWAFSVILSRPEEKKQIFWA